MGLLVLQAQQPLGTLSSIKCICNLNEQCLWSKLLLKCCFLCPPEAWRLVNKTAVKSASLESIPFPMESLWLSRIQPHSWQLQGSEPVSTHRGCRPALPLQKNYTKGLLQSILYTRCSNHLTWTQTGSLAKTTELLKILFKQNHVSSKVLLDSNAGFQWYYFFSSAVKCAVPSQRCLLKLLNDLKELKKRIPYWRNSN